ncbi:LTA synthase family protein [Planococcus sp. ISL-109]|uniref:LTA synthase family protein n=1 Tax=Planococcus sp. ISL-109 TaxID=2819166 RepID=UPI001BE521E5|nr:LTA synthase family protein [Planococcus sp. ISL-109]MBT2583954.1 LTA synthase family protein [Planococcus sp. ISL-109]
MDKLKTAGKFVLGQWDYALFVLLLLGKVYYFSKVSGNLFATLGPVEFVSGFAARLFGAGNEQVFDGVLMISVGTLLLCTFWLLLLSGRKRLFWMAITNIVLSFVILADTVYFRYFEDIISVTVLMQMGQVGDVGDSILALFRLSDALLVVDVLLMAVLLVVIARKKTAIQKPSPWAKVGTALLVLVIGWQMTAVPFNKSMENGGEWQFNKLISNMRVYNFTGLLGFHGANITRYVEDNWINRKVYSTDEISAAQDWFDERNAQRIPGPYSGAASGHNVIVLQVEALQQFVINAEVNGQEITPNLNRLIREGLYFPNFYEQTALGRTSDAEFLLNTSLYPTAEGSAYMLYAENTFDALPAVLQEQGYQTSVFHPYKPSFWNRYLIYPRLGIDRFYSESDFDEAEVIGWAINDEALLDQSLAEMATLPEPFYSHIVTLTSHHPFEMPERLQVLDTEGYGGYHDRHFRNYLHSIHYVDQAIGKFVDGLDQKGMLDHTMLAIFGDHSTGMTPDTEAFNKFTGVEDPFEYFEANKNVPLILNIPGVEPNTFSQVASQLDLAPTLLDILGGDPSAHHFIGRDMWNTDDAQATFRDGSFITNELSFIASSDGLYENGSCFWRMTGEAVGVEACEEPFLEGTKELEMSDDMLRGNLLDKFER